MNNSDNENKWWKHFGDDFIEPRNKIEFEREYLGEFPKPTILDNFEDFVNRLFKISVPKHNRNQEEDFDFFKRIGAYNKQIEIAEELLKLVKYHRHKENNEK